MIFDEENFPELPDSWISLSVEKVCVNLSANNKIQQKNYLPKGKLPIVDQGASLIGGYADNEEDAVTDQFPVIVFGDHTRVIKYVDFKFAAGADGIKVLGPTELLIPRLFYRFLQAIRLPDKGYARHFQYLRSSQIAVPPLNEQKRIADKLDSLLSRVDACHERLDRVPQVLKRFRRAVLTAATSGQLTEDWREKNSGCVGANGVRPGAISKDTADCTKGACHAPLQDRGEGEELLEIPQGWKWVSVGTLAVKVSDGVHKKPEYVAQGIPFITVKNLTAGTGISFSDTNFVTQKDHE